MYRLKPEFVGTRVAKGSQTIFLSEDMDQQELWHLHIMHPGLTISDEEEAEKLRIQKEKEETLAELKEWARAVKEVKLYSKQNKDKDAKSNEKLD